MNSFLACILCVMSTSQTIYNCPTPKVFDASNRALRAQVVKLFPSYNWMDLHSMMFIGARDLKTGAFGEVRGLTLRDEGEDKSKQFAIKKVSPKDLELIPLMIREIELLKEMCGLDPIVTYNKLSECKSTLIAGFYGCVEEGNDLYIFQEKMDRDLADLESLKLYNSLPGREKADVMLRIISKFEELHSKNIVHGNIKPSDIMVIGKGFEELRIVDFGLSGYVGEEAKGGTFYFIPPEKMKGGLLDFEGDIYSLAITFAMMEFSIHHYMSLKMKKSCLDNEVEAPGDCKSPFLTGVKEAFCEKNGTKLLNKIMMKAIDDNPGNRYKSMEEFGNAIRSVRENLPKEKAPPAKEKNIILRVFKGMFNFKENKKYRILTLLTGSRDFDAKKSGFGANKEDISSKVVI